MFITRHWFRVTRHGFGIAWARASSPMLFSMRYGYTRYIVIFGWRFHWLKPCSLIARPGRNHPTDADRKPT